jgi:hypothetical protein
MSELDHTVESFLDGNLQKCFGGKVPPKTRGKETAWNRIQQALKMDPSSVEDLLELRALVLKFLSQSLPRLMEGLDVEDVPAASAKRAIQAWYDRTTTNKADKDAMIPDIKNLRVFVRASSSPAPKRPQSKKRHQTTPNDLLSSLLPAEEEGEELEEVDEEPVDDEEDEEEDDEPLQPIQKKANLLHRDRVSNKKLVKTAKAPVGRLTRLFDDLPCDLPSCRIPPSAVTNVDRWRKYPADRILLAVITFFRDYPADSARSVAYELEEWLDNELPLQIDHLFMLPLTSPQYKHFLLLMDSKLSRMFFKLTIAKKGLKVATETKHESERHEPDLVDWHRSFHAVMARNQQSGFQQPSQAGATGTSGKKSTSN